MKLQDYVKQEFDEVKQTLDAMDKKLDATCERLTIQEVNYKNHTDQVKKEMNNKYKVISIIVGSISSSSVLVAIISNLL